MKKELVGCHNKTNWVNSGQIMARNMETCQMHPNVMKSKSGLSKNQNSVNARRLRGIYSLIPWMRNATISWKMLVEKLETPMPAAMPCKTPMCQSNRETCLENTRQNSLVFLETDESMRIPIGRSSLQISRRSHCSKRYEFTKSQQFGAQICSAASSNANTGCTGSSGKIMWKLEKIPA